MSKARIIRLLIPLLVFAVLLLSSGTAAAQGDAPPENTDWGVALDTVWVLLAGFLVFFMQAGFGFLEAGLVPSKHVANILMENFIDTAITGLRSGP